MFITWQKLLVGLVNLLDSLSFCLPVAKKLILSSAGYKTLLFVALMATVS